MRAVLDTNIIVSAPIAAAGKPPAIINVWLDGRFTLLTGAAHESHVWPKLSNHTRPAAWSTRSRN